jgi:hypothetical protein
LGSMVDHVVWSDQLSTKFLQNTKGKAVVGKVDVDANQNLPQNTGEIFQPY